MTKPDNSHALQPGTQIAEYRIEKLLGEGGFGLTYLAFDTNLEKQVAIKEYLPVEFAQRIADLSVHPRAPSTEELFKWGLDTFITEARTLARFHNQYIVQVYRFIEANNTAYIVMEYVPGRELKAVVRELGRLDQAEIMAILLPIMDGLAEVHDAGILHRDIKPANILIRDNGRPVLIDFGAARQALGSKSRSITSIVTPGYAPVEQYSTKGNVGPWSDIYSLAAVAYYCLTLARPEDATERMLEDHYIPAAECAREQGTPAFLQAIDQGLAVAPSVRPQTLEVWVVMLKAANGSNPSSIPNSEPLYMALEPEPAPSKSEPAVSTKLNKRVGVESQDNRLPLIGLLTAVVAVLVITFAALSFFGGDQVASPTVVDQSDSTTSDLMPDESTGSADQPAHKRTEPSTPAASIPVATTPEVDDNSPGRATPEQPITTPEPMPVATFGLYISTQPAGAEIAVAGIDREYFQGILLAPGNYQVTARLPNYQPATVTLTITDAAVREMIQLTPDINQEELAAYQRARNERSLAALNDYLDRFPAGQYRTEVVAWRAEIEARELQAQQERQRQEQERLVQSRWADCLPLPNQTASLTGRAFIDLGTGGDFNLRLGRFTVQPNAIRRVAPGDSYHNLCRSLHCYEVRGPFGWQTYSIQVGQGRAQEGQVCFHHLDGTPHVYQISPQG